MHKLKCLRYGKEICLYQVLWESELWQKSNVGFEKKEDNFWLRQI